MGKGLGSRGRLRAASTSLARGCSLKPSRLAGLAGSQPPSFLLTGNDFPSLCSYFLRLPNWIWVSDLPSGEEGWGWRVGWEVVIQRLPPSRVNSGAVGPEGSASQQAFLMGPDRALKSPALLHPQARGPHGCLTRIGAGMAAQL